MKNTIDKYGELTLQIRELEKQKKELGDEIKASMEGAAAYGKRFYCTVRVQQRTTIDKKLIPKNILAVCSRITEVRALHVEERE